MRHKLRVFSTLILAAACSAAGWWFLRPPIPPSVPPIAQTQQTEPPEETADEESEPEVGALNVVGLENRALYNEVERNLSECVRNIETDFDGDGEPEKLCVREVWIKTRQCRAPFHALIVDLFKDKQWLLRQQLNPGVFWEERFYLAKDLDGDGQAELITRLQLSPDCSGCTAYRVYTFTEDYFVEALSLFGVSPHSPQVARVLRDHIDILNHIDNRYRILTARKNPCGYGDEPSSCVRGSPWLIDSNANGRAEIVQLIDPPTDDYFIKSRFYRLFVMELSPKKIKGPHRIHPLEMEGDQGFIALLGFLKTRNGRVHALVNFAHPGTSTAYPILNVFEIKGLKLNRVAELYGFYEHVVPDRLWDVNQDGNTEIIHVSSDYWPPGKSHAEVILNYEIVEYRNGKYVLAGPKISEMAVLQEDEEEDR